MTEDMESEGGLVLYMVCFHCGGTSHSVTQERWTCTNCGGHHVRFTTTPPEEST